MPFDYHGKFIVSWLEGKNTLYKRLQCSYSLVEALKWAHVSSNMIGVMAVAQSSTLHG